jgi:ATP-binding cassette, subfamily C, bacterial EexD
LRRRQSTVVIVTHLTQVLSQVDRILLLVGGKLALYGPRDQVTSQLHQAAARVARPASGNGATDAPPSIAAAANG